MRTKGSSWQWVVGIIALIIVVALLLWLPARQSLSAPVFAPTGTVTGGFPPSLLIDSTAKVTQSYSITNSGTNQYTATWNSSATPISIAAGYKLYFQSNNWQIVHQATSSPDIQTVYAENSSGTVSVTAAVNQQTGGTSVTVSYLQKP